MASIRANRIFSCSQCRQAGRWSILFWRGTVTLSVTFWMFLTFGRYETEIIPVSVLLVMVCLCLLWHCNVSLSLSVLKSKLAEVIWVAFVFKTGYVIFCFSVVMCSFRKRKLPLKQRLVYLELRYTLSVVLRMEGTKDITEEMKRKVTHLHLFKYALLGFRCLFLQA